MAELDNTVLFIALIAGFIYVSRRKQLICFRQDDIESHEMDPVRRINDTALKAKIGRNETYVMSDASGEGQTIQGGGAMVDDTLLEVVDQRIIPDEVLPPDLHLFPPPGLAALPGFAAAPGLAAPPPAPPPAYTPESRL